MFVTHRSPHNPILIPNKDHYWEAFATFNICPVKRGREIYGLYRAISAYDSMHDPHQISVIGKGVSRDGEHFINREPFITPEEDWEKYGCEDPRVTFFEGKYYIFYTALSNYPFNAEGIKVAVAISKDLVKVDERHLVTPFNAKAMTIFPERINGKIMVLFSYHTDQPPTKMAYAELDNIEELWSPDFWKKWETQIEKFSIDPRRNDYDHVEVGAPPIKTPHGWLLVYSHIQNYFHHPDGLDRIFGVEALLLDLKDLKTFRGRTSGPVLVPGEPYELSGYVGNITFPSGALLGKDNLEIYYGAADTTGCRATINFKDLLCTMHPAHKDKFSFKRFPQNPIISPKPEHEWEATATFNPAAILLGGKTHILYRALARDNTSSIGYAMSENGVDILERFEQPIYVPREEFESKKIANGNSGCEDPRLTKIGREIYMCYTAFDGIGPPRVAISSISEKDFLARNWKWKKPFLVTPQGVDDKDTCLFPAKFKPGYFIMHRISGEICGDYLNSLDFKNEIVKRCIRIIGPRINMWDGSKVGITAPPLKTKHGWLLLYHGISKSHHTYRVGAVLLDLKDPAIILSRSTDPIFEPVEKYEKEGIINNVVFPCGMTVKDKLLYIYYGGADKVVGVAAMELDVILKALTRHLKSKK